MAVKVPLNGSGGGSNDGIDLLGGEELAVVNVLGVANLPESLIQLVQVALFDEDVKKRSKKEGSTRVI